MSIDWGKLESELGGFKDYAPAGLYKAKLDSVEIHEVGSNGSVAQDFKFADNENYAFPKATHWLSFKNEGWRQLHNMKLMVVLGASEENAKKAVEACESKGDKENIIKAYQQAYERLAKKSPEVEIEVWQDGKYSRSDFTNGSVRMSRPGDDKPQKDDSTDILSGAEDVTAEENVDLPF